jgi:truncated hemoglobin YjbI
MASGIPPFEPVPYRQLAEAFYARVAADPLLRPLFPGKSFRCAIEAFSSYLAQLLGGPPEDTQHRWSLSLRESHLRFQIGPAHREAWMRCMRDALQDVPLPDSARAALRDFFEQSSAYLVNHGDPPRTRSAPLPSGLDLCWNAQLALDQAVAAIRADRPAEAIGIVRTHPLRAYLDASPSAHAALLALMIGARDPSLLVHVETAIVTTPSLLHERHFGRTLLHAAAASGSLAAVELLLRAGASPQVCDSLGHTPLYSLANECLQGGADVVHALVRAGARIDAADGVKRATPLHMAARRGNAEITAALLDNGADIEARDSLGDTPLRRAVNCRQPGVAQLLLQRGADPHSPGSKGLTPFRAARSAVLRQAFLSAGAK